MLLYLLPYCAVESCTLSDYCAMCSDLLPVENEYAILSFSKCKLHFDCSRMVDQHGFKWVKVNVISGIVKYVEISLVLQRLLVKCMSFKYDKTINKYLNSKH